MKETQTQSVTASSRGQAPGGIREVPPREAMSTSKLIFRKTVKFRFLGARFLDGLFILTLLQCWCFAQGTVVWKEDFESAVWDNWLAEGGTWWVGTPSSGPGKPFQGTNCAATGYYENNVNARLISPPFVVPSAEAKPLLRFWHWYKIASGDQGTVEVRPQGGIWQAVSPVYSGSSGGVWIRAWIDLSAYAGQTVELAFRFRSNSSVSDQGWYVDDLQVGASPTRVLPNPEGFESANVYDNWIKEGGTWVVSTPTSGPGKAYAGSKCAGTDYYENNVDARLISPPFVVPSAEAKPFCGSGIGIRLPAGTKGRSRSALRAESGRRCRRRTQDPAGECGPALGST